MCCVYRMYSHYFCNTSNKTHKQMKVYETFSRKSITFNLKKLETNKVYLVISLTLDTTQGDCGCVDWDLIEHNGPT